LLCLRNARAFPLLPAALASVPFGFVLVRVRVPDMKLSPPLGVRDQKYSLSSIYAHELLKFDAG
jgi:hypothetical protein